MINRRTFLAGAAALSAAPLAAAGQPAPVVMWGPPAAPAIVTLEAITHGHVASVLPGATFKAWRTPDEMRAGISSGTMDLVVVPTYVAANLHNRGLGIRLVNVLTDGLLYIVAAPGTIGSVADLRGRKVAVPFRNDMPDYVFKRLLAGAGVAEKDVATDYSGSAPEAVQMLMAGRVDAAMLSEPAATAAILRAGMNGKTLVRAIDCRQAWTGISQAPGLPQAGLAITDRLADRLGRDGLQALQGGLDAACRAVLAQPQQAAEMASPALDQPAPVIARAIPFSNLVARPASSARPEIETLFNALAAQDPRIIGGKLPGDGFYAV